MSDLSAAQLLDLRRNWLRDEWRDSPIFLGISHWNSANKKEFFTDTQLMALDDYVMNEYAEELTALEADKNRVRLGLSDSTVDAATYATNAVRYARYRLIRAEAWELMLSDPGFRASLSEESGSLSSMEIQIKTDRNFVARRTGLVTLPLRRG